MLTVATMAKTFGQRPSALIEIADRGLAFAFDAAATMALVKTEVKAIKRAEREAGVSEDDDDELPVAPQVRVQVMQDLVAWAESSTENRTESE